VNTATGELSFTRSCVESSSFSSSRIQFPSNDSKYVFQIATYSLDVTQLYEGGCAFRQDLVEGSFARALVAGYDVDLVVDEEAKGLGFEEVPLKRCIEFGN